jgi:phenylalanine-4-hydroxylase
MEFTADQHKIWATLFSRQMPSIRKLACKEFLEGLEILNLPLDRIPTLEELNDAITPNSGWKVVRTPVRYSDAVPWYEAFANKQFMVTDYMRTWEELEFTPEPDMFHDIFGHLPFMALRRYAELQEMFAPTFQRANKEQRENIKRLAWFSTEFGLIRQNGELKVFGTGLLSSIGEIENVMSRKVPIMSFTIENVLNYDKAIYNFNEALFAFDSLTDLKSELASYFNSI